MTAYLDAMRHYATFSGRTSRKDFWLFILIYAVILLVCFTIDVSLFGSGEKNDAQILAGIASLIHLIPSLSITVRRLHDSNKSAWFLIPCIIPLVWIIMMVLPSTPGPNAYDSGPLNRRPETMPAK